MYIGIKSTNRMEIRWYELDIAKFTRDNLQASYLSPRKEDFGGC
jgi:hypothetical protein